MQEGPKEIVIPEQKIITCSGCEFYRHSMIKSGMNPVYESTCSRINPESLVRPRISKHHLYNFPVPHEDCPFLQSFHRDKKIDDILT